MRLPFWSRPAPDDRQHAIATLQSLGATSVPGLAAALSWSIPRTERVLKELARQTPSSLVYDVRSGTIRWNPAPTSMSRVAPASAPAPSATPSPTGPINTSRVPLRSLTAATLPPLPAVPARVEPRKSTISPPAVVAAPRVPADDHPLRECTRCHTPLVPTEAADVFSCPMCGRRISGAGTLISPSSSRPGPPPGPDPRIQQLIAAWATGQPTPCPHCRQPLRHTANGEFRCGSCGARVAYDPSPSAGLAAPPSGAAGPVVGPSP